MGEFLRFYGACLARAPRGKLQVVLLWTGLLGPLVSGLDYVISPSQPLERFLTIGLPATFFLVALAGLLFAGFILAPFEMFQEERRNRMSLQERLVPKLKISLPPGGVAGVDMSGNTFEMASG